MFVESELLTSSRLSVTLLRKYLTIKLSVPPEDLEARGWKRRVVVFLITYTRRIWHQKESRMNSTLARVQVTPMRVQREFGIVHAALIAAQKLPAGSNVKQTVHISSSCLFLMFHTGTLCYFFLISWISCAWFLVFFAILFGGFQALIFHLWSTESAALWWAIEARCREFFL